MPCSNQPEQPYGHGRMELYSSDTIYSFELDGRQLLLSESVNNAGQPVYLLFMSNYVDKV